MATSFHFFSTKEAKKSAADFKAAVISAAKKAELASASKLRNFDPRLFSQHHNNTFKPVRAADSVVNKMIDSENTFTR